MNAETKLPNELSPTSSTLTDVFGEALGRPFVAPETDVRYVEFDHQAKPAPGMLSLGDLDAMLAAGDPDFNEGMVEARKWAADALYPDEKSVRQLRLERGMSQTELAERIGTSQPHVARIEAGKTDPQSDTIEKLASALSVAGEEMYCIVRTSRGTS